MYSMNLDSVREKNTSNQIMAEVSLMRAALLGSPAVLSPNQAMDSLALQEIILANNKTDFRSNSFCRAVELGIVRVAIPGNFRDLVDCCLDSLNRGLDDSRSEFIISGLNFLYEKDETGHEVHPYEQRCEVTRAIIKSLTEGRKKYTTVTFPDWLSDNEKDMIRQYIESIVLLDRAVDTYENFTSVKHLFPGILEKLAVERLTEEEPDTELASILDILRKECTKPGAPIYRSYYYRFTDELRHDYSAETLAEVRTIIDIAYNRIMALSVSTDSEVSIPNNFDKLSDSIIKSEEPECAFQSSYETETDVSGLDWEMIIWIYEEIHEIMKEKGLDWRDALNALYVRESKMPFVLSGKYICYTSIKVVLSSFIPGGAIINFIQELIDDISGDVAGDRLPGSPREVIKRSRQAKEAKNILDTIIFKESKKDDK